MVIQVVISPINGNKLNKSDNNHEIKVCFTADDCNQNTETELPLYCRNRYDCLCNQWQHSNYDEDDDDDDDGNLLMNKCIKCSSVPELDLCTKLDPYSFCNHSTSYCQCTSIESTEIESKYDEQVRTICRGHHIDLHLRELNVEHMETLSEWLLTIFLAYILPGLFISAAIYFIYKQGCCCTRSNIHNSEMILYRQL